MCVFLFVFLLGTHCGFFKYQDSNNSNPPRLFDHTKIRANKHVVSHVNFQGFVKSFVTENPSRNSRPRGRFQTKHKSARGAGKKRFCVRGDRRPPRACSGKRNCGRFYQFYRTKLGIERGFNLISTAMNRTPLSCDVAKHGQGG